MFRSNCCDLEEQISGPLKQCLAALLPKVWINIQQPSRCSQLSQVYTFLVAALMALEKSSISFRWTFCLSNLFAFPGVTKCSIGKDWYFIHVCLGHRSTDGCWQTASGYIRKSTANIERIFLGWSGVLQAGRGRGVTLHGSFHFSLLVNLKSLEEGL